jgi:hypothetical protein
MSNKHLVITPLAVLMIVLASTPGASAPVGELEGTPEMDCKGMGNVYNCTPMPHSRFTDIADIIQPRGIWSPAFRHTSPDCQYLFHAFESSYDAGNVFLVDTPAFSDLQGTQAGEVIGIRSALFDMGNGTLLAQVSIHESAHVTGCTDAGESAQQWAEYCVPGRPDVGPPPPPPSSCWGKSPP